jgi:hypothetical protein
MMACMFTTGIKSVLTRRFRREQSGSQNSGRHWARRLSDGTVSNMTRGRRLVLWGNGSRNNGRGENQGSSLGRASGEAWRSQGESWQSGVSLVWAGVCDQRAGKRSHALRALCYYTEPRTRIADGGGRASAWDVYKRGCRRRLSGSTRSRRRLAARVWAMWLPARIRRQAQLTARLPKPHQKRSDDPPALLPTLCFNSTKHSHPRRCTRAPRYTTTTYSYRHSPLTTTQHSISTANTNTP